MLHPIFGKIPTAVPETNAIHGFSLTTSLSAQISKEPNQVNLTILPAYQFIKPKFTIEVGPFLGVGRRFFTNFNQDYKTTGSQSNYTETIDGIEHHYFINKKGTVNPWMKAAGASLDFYFPVTQNFSIGPSFLYGFEWTRNHTAYSLTETVQNENGKYEVNGSKLDTDDFYELQISSAVGVSLRAGDPARKFGFVGRFGLAIQSYAVDYGARPELYTIVNQDTNFLFYLSLGFYFQIKKKS